MVPLYAELVRGFVQPNLGVLGWLIWGLEAAIAASLLLGLLARLGGFLGFAQAMNLYVGLAAVPHEWSWTYWMLAILCAPFALTGAERWLGLDGALLARRRVPPLLARLM